MAVPINSGMEEVVCFLGQGTVPRLVPYNGDADVDAGMSMIKLTGASRIARGAFGDISVVAFMRRQQQCETLRHGNGLQGTTSFITSFTVGVIKTLFHSIAATTTTTVVSSWPDRETTEGWQQHQLLPEFQREIHALKLLAGHANIVELVACSWSHLHPHHHHCHHPPFSLCFVYHPTDLFLSLENRRRNLLQSLSWNVVRSLSIDLVAAVHHCHRHGILHRDIKPGNCLVTATGALKLCDFGLSKPFNSDHDVDDNGSDKDSQPKKQQRSKGLCTLHYRPPEVLLGAHGPMSSTPADIYSAGLVIGEMVAGCAIFAGLNDLDQLGQIMVCLGTPSSTHWPGVLLLPHGNLHFVPQVVQRLDSARSIPRLTEMPALIDLLEHMICLDPSQRWTSSQIAEHAWISGHQHNRIPMPANSRQLQHELLDPQFDTPVLLSRAAFPQERNKRQTLPKCITKQTENLASERRHQPQSAWHRRGGSKV